MVQSSQSVPGQIEAAIRRADARTRAGKPPAATPQIFDGQQKPADENAADIALLLAPGKPRNADGTEYTA